MKKESLVGWMYEKDLKDFAFGINEESWLGIPSICETRKGQEENAGWAFHGRVVKVRITIEEIK